MKRVVLLFSLWLLCLALSAQDSLTRRDVYDYNIGDEFNNGTPTRWETNST
ncbi:MAG: hypothetical protein AAFW73_21135 [Bacteroidota bacterium]